MISASPVELSTGLVNDDVDSARLRDAAGRRRETVPRVPSFATADELIAAKADELGGLLPSGMCALHRCDFPPCVNPAHLFEGTQLDNIADRDAKGRQQRGGRHSKAKLTEAVVAVVKARLESGESYRTIAEELGVFRPCIHSISTNTNWKHVAPRVATGATP